MYALTWMHVCMQDRTYACLFRVLTTWIFECMHVCMYVCMHAHHLTIPFGVARPSLQGPAVMLHVSRIRTCTHHVQSHTCMQRYMHVCVHACMHTPCTHCNIRNRFEFVTLVCGCVYVCVYVCMQAAAACCAWGISQQVAGGLIYVCRGIDE